MEQTVDRADHKFDVVDLSTPPRDSRKELLAWIFTALAVALPTGALVGAAVAWAQT